jgi:serine/threonine protein kinase
MGEQNGTREHPSSSSSSSSCSVAYFRGESVTEIDAFLGNTKIARGQFGEISLAVWNDTVDVVAAAALLHDAHPPHAGAEKSNRDDEEVKADSSDPPVKSLPVLRTRRVVAIKTLQRALLPALPPRHLGGDGGGGMSAGGGNYFYLLREVYNEIVALQLLHPHPNIVPLLAVYPSRRNHGGGLSLAFDYCPADLRLALEWRRRTFRPLLPPSVVQLATLDLLRALEHCHDCGVVHCDVTPGNLLVSSNGLIRLSDFGIANVSESDCSVAAARPATIISDNEGTLPPPEPIDDESDAGREPRLPRALCTLHYRPPEILLGGTDQRPSGDVWGAGLVVAELLTGRPLFPGRNAIDQLCRVFDGVGTPTPSHYPGASLLPDHGKLPFQPKPPRPVRDLLPRCTELPGMEDLLAGCLVLDPEKRPSASGLLSHLSSCLDPQSLGQRKDGADRVAAFEGDPAFHCSMRSLLIAELVPRDLDEPVLLSTGGGGTSDSEPAVLALAARRRKILQTASDQARKILESSALQL